MKNAKLWLGLAISLGLIVWVFSQVDLRRLGQTLMQANYWYVLACLPLYWLKYALVAVRWECFLRPIKKVPYSSLIAATIIGFTGNLLLPARLGEIIRGLELSRREKVPLASGLATVVLERILDGVAIIGSMLLGAAFIGVWESGSATVAATRNGLVIFSGAYVVVLAVAAALGLSPDRSLGFFRLLARPLPERWSGKLLSLCEGAILGFRSLGSPRILIMSLVYTVIIWIVNAIPFWLMTRAFDRPTPLAAAFFVQGLVCLAIALPSAPGFIGVMHAAIQFGYGTFLGLPAETSLAVAIIYHGSVFLFTIFYCLTFLAKGQVSLLQLGRLAERRPGAVESDRPA